MRDGLSIDAGRVADEIRSLAEFSDAPAPAVTRVLFSDADMAARHYLAGKFQEAGLQVRTDSAGNMFARWAGSTGQLPAVATGSHTDAIPYSGQYDGTVGVLGGLEAIRALQSAGFQPTRPIELVMFTSEEPTRFGVGCLGSRLLSGSLGGAEADALADEQGITFQVARQERGFPGSLEEVRMAAGHYSAFVELHIEQGPVLEQQQVAIGAVTHIAAPAALSVSYTGTGGHAGAVLMRQRKDALLPAAELVLAVESAALEIGGEDTVATTGILDVHPRAVNSIPSRTGLKIDVRDIDLARRDAVLAEIQQRARQIGGQRKQDTNVQVTNADPPATCDPRVVGSIEAACQQSGLSCQRMVSRAYHDTLFMSMVCGAAMIFIPCCAGISHRPEEYASPGAIADGIRVLALTLAKLSA